MKLVERKEYMDKLYKLRDMDLIKVITGVRRSGKSTLLQMFRDQILQDVDPKRIQHFNFEERQYVGREWTELYDEIDKKLVKGKKNYIFLDEVQNVPKFARFLDALFVNPDVDLYVTGSNAYLLSSELATLLTGRSFTINILPFSFKEFCETFERTGNDQKLYDDYVLYSSLPKAVELLHTDFDLVDDYVKDVYETILVSDVSMRHNVIKEQTFENVAKFAMDNIGNVLSPNSIATALSADNKNVDSRTVEEYMKALSDSYVFYRAERFDLKGKNILATQQKYYLADLGFRNALLGREVGADNGRVLENIVYLELLHRGNQVWIGKVGTHEIDFVARKNGVDTYYQVAYSVHDQKTLDRELAAFDATNDHNVKVLITADYEEGLRNGVRQVNAVKWLLGETSEFTL